MGLELLQQREGVGLAAGEAVYGVDDHGRDLPSFDSTPKLCEGGALQHPARFARVDEHLHDLQATGLAQCAAAGLL